MKKIIGLPKQRPSLRQVGAPPAAAAAPGTGTPVCVYVGDVEVPWNIGVPVFRYKAARALKLTDITITTSAIISPSGAPIVLEAWRNGQYAGTTTINPGNNTFPDAALNKLDDIELRILVKGEHKDTTEVKGLWFLFSVL